MGWQQLPLPIGSNGRSPEYNQGCSPRTARSPGSTGEPSAGALSRCQQLSCRILVGRIGNPSVLPGRIANPSYSQTGRLFLNSGLRSGSGDQFRRPSGQELSSRLAPDRFGLL